MDIDGLTALLQRIESGEVKVAHARPAATLRCSPWRYSARVPTPISTMRRSRSAARRRWLRGVISIRRLRPTSAGSTRRPSSGCVKKHGPILKVPDELHDALMLLGALPEEEGRGAARVSRPGWQDAFDALLAARRATRVVVGTRTFWAAAEQLPLVMSVQPRRKARSTDRRARRIRARRAGAQRCDPRAPARTLQALGPSRRASWTPRSPCLPAAPRRRSPRSRAKASSCAGISPIPRRWAKPATPRKTGMVASAACSRASTGTRSARCVRRSSRPRAPTSCASCSNGRASRVIRRARVRRAWRRCSSSSRASRFPPWRGERDVLPARLNGYDAAWLDTLCLSGRIVWARLDVPKGTVAGPVRATPIALLTRAAAAVVACVLAAPARRAEALVVRAGRWPSSSRHAAPRSSTKLMRGQRAAAGAGGERARRAGGRRPRERRQLRWPARPAAAAGTQAPARGARPARGALGLEEAGRWSLLRPLDAADTASQTAAADARDPADDPQQLEQIAWRLLQRYGVIFRRVLTREAPWLPPWHALLRVLRRLEAQGHVRGRPLRGRRHRRAVRAAPTQSPRCAPPASGRPTACSYR